MRWRPRLRAGPCWWNLRRSHRPHSRLGGGYLIPFQATRRIRRLDLSPHENPGYAPDRPRSIKSNQIKYKFIAPYVEKESEALTQTGQMCKPIQNQRLQTLNIFIKRVHSRFLDAQRSNM